MKNLYALFFVAASFVMQAQVPTASFAIAQTSFCPNQSVQITNLSTGATSYTFVLDGSTSVVATAPAISFSTDGSHYVNLYAENSSGISTPFGIPVIVNPEPVISTGTAGTVPLSPPNGATNGWLPMVWNFNDPLPTGAVLTGVTLTFTAVDQGWGNTGATANFYIDGKLIGGAQLSHSLQNFTLSLIAPYPSYVYSGNNMLEMYFVGWSGWQAFFTNGSMTLHYQTNAQQTAICYGAPFTLNAIGASTYTWLPAAVNGQSFVPTASTLYTVSGTNSFGCVGSTTQQLSVLTATVAAPSATICGGQTYTIVPIGAQSYTISGGQFTVSPATSTSYSVIGTGTNGCVSNVPAVVNIAVVPLPTVSVNSGTVCRGASFTLQPSGATTYSFENGSAVQTIVSSANFTVMGYNTLGCAATSPAVASVTMHPVPVITIDPAIVCLGNSHTLQVSGANSYTYSSGSAVITPTASSTYTVLGENSFGCVGIQTAIIQVSECTGITEVINHKDFQMAPNPTAGELHFTCTQDIMVHVLDQTGRIVNYMHLKAGEQTVNLQLAAGLYYLRSSESTKVYKVVVQ